MFSPSPQQADFFRALASGVENLILIAGAGTGKTTTIVESLKVLPVRDVNSLLPPSIVFLAFNKNIVEKLVALVPRHVMPTTFHSLGLRALKSVIPKPKIESRKVIRMIWNAVDRDDPDQQAIGKLVSLCKSQWPAPSSVDEVRELAVRYDLELDDVSFATSTALAVFRKSCEKLDEIDFDDMLFLPVLLGCKFTPQDYVFVDEAQDTNDIQLEILSRLAKPNNGDSMVVLQPNDVYVGSKTRYVFVGDPHQAIYGFRGANSDSMSLIAKRFSCKTMPLSVSFRCPKAVVAEARKYLKQENQNQ